jgi:hypothetical protein
MGTGTSGKTKKSVVVDKRVTWAQTARDVLIAAMDKGQLVPLALFLIILLMIWVTPSDQIPVVEGRLLALVQNHAVFGYILWLVTVGFWFLHAKYMRTEHNKETGRIGREKSQLQEKLSGKDLPSSRRN